MVTGKSGLANRAHTFCSTFPEKDCPARFDLIDGEIRSLLHLELPGQIETRVRSLEEETGLSNRRNFLVGSAMASGAFLRMAGLNIDDNGNISEGKSNIEMDQPNHGPRTVVGFFQFLYHKKLKGGCGAIHCRIELRVVFSPHLSIF